MTDTPKTHGDRIREGRERAKQVREAQLKASPVPATYVHETASDVATETYAPMFDEGEMDFVDRVLATYASGGVGTQTGKVKYLYQGIAQALQARRIVREIMAGLPAGVALPPWTALDRDENSGRPIPAVVKKAEPVAAAPASYDPAALAALAKVLGINVNGAPAAAPAPGVGAPPNGGASADAILAQFGLSAANRTVPGNAPVTHEQMAEVAG